MLPWIIFLAVEPRSPVEYCGSFAMGAPVGCSNSVFLWRSLLLVTVPIRDIMTCWVLNVQEHMYMMCSSIGPLPFPHPAESGRSISALDRWHVGGHTPVIAVLGKVSRRTVCVWGQSGPCREFQAILSCITRGLVWKAKHQMTWVNMMVCGPSDPNFPTLLWQKLRKLNSTKAKL